jgi:hypothetical protein
MLGIVYYAGALPSLYDPPSKERNPMGDLSFLFITAAFFAVSIAYAYFCEKVR